MGCMIEKGDGSPFWTNGPELWLRIREDQPISNCIGKTLLVPIRRTYHASVSPTCTFWLRWSSKWTGSARESATRSRRSMDSSPELLSWLAERDRDRDREDTH
jgi:hypothetical protein